MMMAKKVETVGIVKNFTKAKQKNHIIKVDFYDIGNRIDMCRHIDVEIGRKL